MVVAMTGIVAVTALGYNFLYGLPSLATVLLGLLVRQTWQIFGLAVLATLWVLIDPNFHHTTGVSDIIEHGLAVTAVWVAAALIYRIRKNDLQARTAEHHQQRVLDAAMDAIISIDDTGRVTYFNQSAETMFGITRDRVLGHDLADIIIPEDNRNAHRQGLSAALNNSGAELLKRRVEISALRADGGEFPIELTITENRQSRQRFTAFIRDLTDIKNAARDMTIARDEAIAANQTKTRFLANISRELRTPLTTILGYSELALSADGNALNQVTRDYLAYIRIAGETLQETVDRLLAISHAGTLVGDEDHHHQQLFDLTPDMICICRAGRVATINQAGLDMLDAEGTGQIIGRVFTDFLHEEDRLRIGTHATEADPSQGNNGPVRTLVRIPRDDGSHRNVEMSELVIEFENHPATMIVGRDVTSEMRSRRESNRQRKLLSILHETTVIANNAANPKDAIGAVLREVCTQTGWPVGHAYLLDTDDNGILRSSGIWHFDVEQPYRELRQVTESTTFHFGEGLPGEVLREAAPLWIADVKVAPNFPRARQLTHTDIKSVFAFPVLAGPKVVGVLEFFSPRDNRPDDLLFNALNHIGTQVGRVLEREKAKALLIRQANFDPLTGLPNRVLAMDRLTQSIQMANRDGQAVVVISVDLDDFKKVNDSLGHEAGDRIIVEAARRLETSLRKSDTVANLGGDEFLVVIKDIPNGGRAAALADKLLATLRNPFSIDGTQIFVSASLGISVFPSDGEDAPALLRHADAAMFSAKSAGRDTYRFFSPEMNANSQRLLSMDTHLRYALDAGELYPVYQPIVDTVSGHPVALETLLRWENPELGFVRPDQFIPVAENSGEIIRIGSWLIDQACQDLLSLKHQGFPHLRIAINISPKQFMRGTILKDVRHALEHTGLAPNDLELEVTEGLLMIDTPEIIDTLRALHDMGVGLSIDDFGTGYSSLSYLRRYPFDTLKIDKSFIDGVTDDSENAALVAGIISMSHAMGMKVICEGVENPPEHAFLERHQGDYIQGYLFGKPDTLPNAVATLHDLQADDLLLEA